MRIDPSRHQSIFSPFAFGKRRVDVIGVGAVGSRVVMELAKLGVQNIHVWDFDSVEAHNVANQLFGLEDVGKSKVEALRERVLRDTGTEIQIHSQRVDGTQVLGEIVFVLPDTMSSRKEIWTKGLKYKLRTKLVVETRMGASQGRVYVLNPNRPSHISGYEATLYDDKPADPSACGTSITVGATAGYLASLAATQLIRWFSVEQGGEDVLDNEILFSLWPMLTCTRQFE